MISIRLWAWQKVSTIESSVRLPDFQARHPKSNAFHLAIKLRWLHFVRFNKKPKKQDRYRREHRNSVSKRERRISCANEGLEPGYVFIHAYLLKVGLGAG